jgi:ubiquinone/menaquinone biosynthesis C-methylase UbiE
MTWEETIEYIRDRPAYNELVEKAYFDENLELNVSRFRESDEYSETLNIFKEYAPEAKTILDIGCGNGVSTINFAQHGYDVTAVEPDPSTTVGSGAIKILKDKFKLNNIEIYQAFAEDIHFRDNTFDIVYIRQAMHHANNLNDFVRECIRVLKPKGLLLTVRDHVILDQKDKEWFFQQHSLHKFYGGENAFMALEYRNAITRADAVIKVELKHYDSIINYFPQSKEQINNLKSNNVYKQKNKVKRKLGLVSKIPFSWNLYKIISSYKPLDEKKIPGRMYSYIAIKK